MTDTTEMNYAEVRAPECAGPPRPARAPPREGAKAPPHLSGGEAHVETAAWGAGTRGTCTPSSSG